MNNLEKDTENIKYISEINIIKTNIESIKKSVKDNSVEQSESIHNLSEQIKNLIDNINYFREDVNRFKEDSKILPYNILKQVYDMSENLKTLKPYQTEETRKILNELKSNITVIEKSFESKLYTHFIEPKYKNILISYPTSGTVSLSSGTTKIDFYNGTVSGASGNLSGSLSKLGFEYIRSFTIYTDKQIDISVIGEDTLSTTILPGIYRVVSTKAKRIIVITTTTTNFWIVGSVIANGTPDFNNNEITILGKYEATPTTYTDGDVVPIAVDANGRIALSSDIEIGAVELKDADTDGRANIKVANTARTTGTLVVATQPIDATGAVLSTSAIKTAVEVIDNFISGSRGLVTEDNSASIKTAVEAVNTALQAAGITQVQLAAIKTAVEAAKTVAQIQDWTAVAQNTVVKSATYDFSGKHAGILHVQAALDTTTAHTGTRMIVQISSNTAGDEDWQNLTEFVALIGTAATDLIENDPLAAAATSITLTGHALTVLGRLLFIEDGTLANSEIVLESATAANAITIIDGTTNAHVVTTAIFNVAMTQDVSIPVGVNRIRLVVDNGYDSDGSSINYKVRISTVL